MSQSNKSTITITYGERVENHVGMQQIGELGESGLSLEDLKRARRKFKEKGFECKLLHLNGMLGDKGGEAEAEDAYLLVVKKGVNAFGNSDDMLVEQKGLEWDKKAYMYGKVVNKHARYNLCYDEVAQEPNYEEKKGRVVAFDDIPFTKSVKEGLGDYFGDKCKDLKAEGNYYYDSGKCGIGFHGDAERKIVIAVRLGATIPIRYHWYRENKREGSMFSMDIEHGDLYAMSDKATGNDWKKRKKLTLRHAAGCNKYVK